MISSIPLLLALFAASPVTSINGGNALTLPAQRHIVRVEVTPQRAVWLAAVQRDGAGGDGLVFLRSDDEAQTFSRYLAIQPDRTHRDTAELLVVGRDVAVVYSYEGATLGGSTRHDVFFQWWRHDAATDGFVPGTAVRVFDSVSSSTAFSRAELARDSLGRLWVQAFRLNANGTHTAVVAVSTDEGLTFVEQPALDTLSNRGGGRILSLGQSLLFVYDAHGPSSGARMRLRADAAPLDSWGPVTVAFSDGVYHGAALSAVASGGGTAHLVYKGANDERLYYRPFNGSSFGARVLLDGSADWALQPAITGVAEELFVFFTHRVAGTSNYQLRLKRLRGGVWGPDVVLDGSPGFKGYPNAAQTLSTDGRAVIALYASTADPGVGGLLMSVEVPPHAGAADGGVPDAGTTQRDAGSAAPDAGSGQLPPGLLFEDQFNRQSAPLEGLGASWHTVGRWYTDGRAVTDLHGENRALEHIAACRDCRAEAKMIGFGVPTTALILRAPTPSSADRYQLVLTGSGRVQVQRVRAGVITTLGEAASGLSDLTVPASFAFTVSGSSPVVLEVFVNGVARLSVTDASTSALTSAGYAGLYTTRAGVVFDDFRLFGTSGAPAPPDAGAQTTDGGGAADAGLVSAPPDAGVSATLTVTPVHTDTSRRMLAVTPSGMAIAVSLSDNRTLLVSRDHARTFSVLGRHPNSASFLVMTALANGTLIADVMDGAQHQLARSTNGGASWQNVLALGQYRALTPHSFAELDGVAYFLEYQSFTGATTPIRLWASSNGGLSWSTRATFTTSRHGHGLAADAVRGALWAFFGDTTAQSGVWRSTSAGASWTKLLAGQQGDVVDATLLSDGSLLFGQDISYLPPTPHIARLTPAGGYTESIRLSGPSYSTHALRGGGFIVGAAREPGGDVYASGETRAHLYTSPDGIRWTDALRYPRLSSDENARADVYWELPSGELVVELENILGMGAGGKGFQLLRVTR